VAARDRTTTATISPRLAIRWDATPVWAFKAGAGLYSQGARNGDPVRPFGNPDVLPERAFQLTVGAEVRPLPGLFFSAEAFYKRLSDIIVRSPDSEVVGGQTLPVILDNAGTGRVTGIEVLLRKELTSRLFGWLAYTYSRSQRIDRPGEPWRPFDFDQTHNLTAIVSYKLPRGWQIGARLRWITGNPETPVVGSRYLAPLDVYLPIYGATNSDRVPAVQPARRPHRQGVDVRRLDARRVPRRAQRVQPAPGRGHPVQLRFRPVAIPARIADPPDARAEGILLMRACAALAALFLGGCQGDLEKQSEIVKLRVLAVQAEPAELIVDPARPPPRTTLTALAVEPSGAPVAVEYALCTVQQAVPPPDVDCPGSQGIPLAPAGPTSAVLDLGDPRAIALALQLAQDGGTAGALPPEGIPVLVGFPRDGAGAWAARRRPARSGRRRRAGAPGAHDRHRAWTRCSAQPEPGDRPAADGGDWDRLGRRHRRAGEHGPAPDPVPTPGSKEPADGGVEALGYSFFATAGSISSLRSTDTTATGQPEDTSVDWTTPGSAQQARLWVVVRDGRGGVGWIARSVQVTPPAAR